MNSRNHHMWSAVSTYLVKHAAGLDQAPGSAGFRELTLAPGSHPGLSAASVSLDRPTGTLELSWAWQGGVHCATAAEGDSVTLDCGARGGVISKIRFASFGDDCRCPRPRLL